MGVKQELLKVNRYNNAESNLRKTEEKWKNTEGK